MKQHVCFQYFLADAFNLTPKMLAHLQRLLTFRNDHPRDFSSLTPAFIRLRVAPRRRQLRRASAPLVESMFRWRPTTKKWGDHSTSFNYSLKATHTQHHQIYIYIYTIRKKHAHKNKQVHFTAMVSMKSLRNILFFWGWKHLETTTQLEKKLYQLQITHHRVSTYTHLDSQGQVRPGIRYFIRDLALGPVSGWRSTKILKPAKSKVWWEIFVFFGKSSLEMFMGVEPKIGGFYPQNGWWK